MICFEEKCKKNETEMQNPSFKASTAASFAHKKVQGFLRI